MITQAAQDYLKVIYSIASKQEKVSTNAIAERMQVSQASTTGMIKKLSELKLVTHKPYYGVKLTEHGKKIALEIIRHHRLLELYLAEALGYSWDEVHAEAEKLEHHISEEFEERMAAFLGDPRTDPHGAPIPTREGYVEEQPLMKLTDAKAGKRVVVKQVNDEDSEMLRYLGKIGIFPEVELNILERIPFGGPLRISVDGNEHHLGDVITNNIFVEV